VKDSGIAILKQYEIVKGLEDAFDTGSTRNIDGALNAIERLSDRLGLLFGALFHCPPTFLIEGF
jgi:hypothetical protein